MAARVKRTAFSICRKRISAALMGSLLLVVAACSGSGSKTVQPPNATTTPNASSTSTNPGANPATTQSPVSTSPASSSTSPASTRTTGPAGCTTSQLTIAIAGIDGGLGHAGSVVLFANTGNVCTLRGYPGLDATDANGKVVVSAKRTQNGYLGGPTGLPQVVLQTNEVASALFEGLSGPLEGGPPCPAYVTLVITPPNETDSVQIPSIYSLCYLEIHPVVLGSTGGAYAP